MAEKQSAQEETVENRFDYIIKNLSVTHDEEDENHAMQGTMAQMIILEIVLFIIVKLI